LASRLLGSPVSATIQCPVVKAHADDIVDTWRVEHIVNAVKRYDKEYRVRRPLRDHVTGLAPLPVDTPDEEIPPSPTPLSPEEISESGRGATTPLKPKDLFFRDIREFAAGIPNPMPDYETRVPVWWYSVDKE
jgi:hypothetical protein